VAWVRSSSSSRASSSSSSSTPTGPTTATSEALKHEKFLYLAHAGTYATAANPDALLAERIEGRVSQEHASWASEQSQGQGHQK
jgi:hypothetical protein